MAVPVVPVFPAGLPVQGAQLQNLCTALTYCFTGKPLARLEQAVVQSIPTSTSTALTWDTKIVDRDGGWSSGANTRYTAQTAGIYMVAACVSYATNTTLAREVSFRVTTGSNNPGGSGVQTPFAAGDAAAASNHNTSRAVRFLTPYMYVNDYIEVMTFQSSGGALNTSITAAGGLPFFSVELVSG